MSWQEFAWNYTEDRVTSVLWAFAPSLQDGVLRVNEVPPIESILIDRPNEPAWGAGEPAIGTRGGAIGNALFAAAGVRLRTLPMTPERVKGGDRRPLSLRCRGRRPSG